MQSEHVSDPAEPGLRSAERGGSPFFKRVAPTSSDKTVMHPHAPVDWRNVTQAIVPVPAFRKAEDADRRYDAITLYWLETGERP